MKDFRLEMLVAPTFFAKFSYGVAKKRRSCCNSVTKFNIRQKNPKNGKEKISFSFLDETEKCIIFL
jgi:hypothetical protein